MNPRSNTAMSIHRLFHTTLIAAAALGTLAAAAPARPADGKLKIFVLSGQSNMVGFGQVKGSPGTMETYVKGNPQDYGHLVDKNGLQRRFGYMLDTSLTC